MLDVSILFDILADDTRRRIISLLVGGDERCVCELFEALDLPQPKVSRHLAIMRESDIVVSRKVGTWVFYRLNPSLPLWAARILDLMTQGLAAEGNRARPLSEKACCT